METVDIIANLKCNFLEGARYLELDYISTVVGFIREQFMMQVGEVGLEP